MKILIIRHPQSGACCLKADALEKEGNNPLNIVEQESKALIEEGSIGDSITITLGEMTDEEYEQLPEFTGW